MTSHPDLQLEMLDIESYLAGLASSASTPGGGAVAGLAGAQAAALLNMVCKKDLLWLLEQEQLQEC